MGASEVNPARMSAQKSTPSRMSAAEVNPARMSAQKSTVTRVAAIVPAKCAKWLPDRSLMLIVYVPE